MERSFRMVRIALQLSMEDLKERIVRRVDGMVHAGLEEEVRSLLPYQHLNALQTVGYKEFFSYFGGTLKKGEAIEKIKITTRQYAKRQMTWFKNEKSYLWMQPHAQEVLHGINMMMKD